MAVTRVQSCRKPQYCLYGHYGQKRPKSVTLVTALSLEAAAALAAERSAESNSAGLVIAGNHCSLTKHDDADANMSIRRL